jgi:hypothetical protein
MDVIMGGAGRSAHFWRYIILIATMNQGITPDPQDLASAKLLSVVCSVLGFECGLDDEDNSADDACEPFRLEQNSRIRQVGHKIPPRGRVAFSTYGKIPSANVRPVLLDRNEALRPGGPMHLPGRLRC